MTTPNARPTSNLPAYMHAPDCAELIAPAVAPDVQLRRIIATGKAVRKIERALRNVGKLTDAEAAKRHAERIEHEAERRAELAAENSLCGFTD